MQFADLRLIEPLLRAVRTAGYDQPTPIQCSAIPHILEGRDVLGCAQTGTGKTAAFALPILQRLSERPARETSARRIRTLVLCPTRELASQIFESFRTYGRHTSLRPTVVFGGVNQGPQVRAIRAGVDILVATPGRLRDLMGQGLINLSGIEILVLDESDRMLDMGFLPDLRKIVAAVPAKRQTLLFSATMPAPIRKLTEDILTKPVTVEVTPVSSACPTVDHWVYHVEKPQKMTLLTSLLAKSPDTRALIFTRTKHGADKVVRQLMQSGVAAAALHGNKSQGARTRALDDFRAARTLVLVATDIAARGLDVDDISHVYNYDMTGDPETYIHRTGRTGRAGASGKAVSFCSSEERESLADIERLLREPLQCAGRIPRSSGGDSAAPDRRPAPARSQSRSSSRGPANRSAPAPQPVQAEARRSVNSHRSKSRRRGSGMRTPAAARA